MRHLHTQERKDKIMAMWKKGDSYLEIANEFKTTKNSIAGTISRERTKKKRNVFGD